MVSAVVTGSGAARVLPMGERAVLAEVDDLGAVLALHAALRLAPPPGVVDVVPAARTVLITFDPARTGMPAIRAWVEGAARGPSSGGRAGGTDAPARPPVPIDVVYDGPDLVRTADLLGMGPGELIARHERTDWMVAFTGFAPGFGYLTSPGWTFDVPRLDAPRTRVPAGSVGLAGAFSGVYPRDTPGGWRLIGTTSAHLFDPAAARPALLGPGDRVRFRHTDALSAPPASRASRSSRATTSVARTRPAIRVVEPGLLATVQDLGRAGHASIGVARSGALDRESLRIANRIVGNPEAAAGIEITLGGFRAVAERDMWIAVTGGFGPLTLDGRAIGPYTAQPWRAGSELQVGWLDRGARAYLAVRGGIAGADVLGSRATDTLAGLGPAPLGAGDALAVGDTPRDPVPPLDVAPWGPPPDEVELDVAPGPRADWFEASALRLLHDAVWTLSGDSDRVGARLEGPELARVRGGELPSEGMVPGALQVPPSGRPTVLLADGPVTGGYPVIAVVTDASLDALGRARPGTRIRFRHARP